MTGDLRATETELRQLLVDELGVLDAAMFESAKQSAQRLRMPIERALTERARLPLSFVVEHLARLWGVGFSELKVSDINYQALLKVNEDYAKLHLVAPFDISETGLSVAMADPRNAQRISELRHITGLPIVPFLAPVLAIRRTHLLFRAGLRDLLRPSAPPVTGPVKGGAKAADDPTASELLTKIIEYAVVTAASDIHIEPYEFETVVRCRIDGTLREALTVLPQALQPLVARIKVLAGLRIDERRAPQDGHFDVDLSGVLADLRVSTLPTHWGEKVVMRVIPKEASTLDLEDLGLAATDLPVVRRHILRPFGMVLITGPTGSGKTTSLYAMLS